MATFCLLHGKWHCGTCWEPLVRELEQRGHRCLTPDLPFDDPAAGHVQRAQPALDAVRAAEPPVVVVGHSLAAGVATLVAEEPGVALLVYLCPAPAGPLGRVDVGVRPIRDGFAFPPDRADRTSVWQPDAAMAAMYPRLPPATARALTASLRAGSNAPDPYPLQGGRDVRTALVAARADEFFQPEWSRRVASAVTAAEAIEIDSGHFPMIEAPGELARILDEIAPA